MLVRGPWLECPPHAVLIVKTLKADKILIRSLQLFVQLPTFALPFSFCSFVVGYIQN